MNTVGLRWETILLWQENVSDYLIKIFLSYFDSTFYEVSNLSPWIASIFLREGSKVGVPLINKDLYSNGGRIWVMQWP